MTNVVFPFLEDYRDIETFAAYDELIRRRGVFPDTMMDYIHRCSRDNARTPMLWSNAPNAGFSPVSPWIGGNPNYAGINADDEMRDPDSVFHYYRKLIALRKQHRVIVYGSYEAVDETNPVVYAYTRSLRDEKLLVICSFSETEAQFMLPEEFRTDERTPLISNYEVPNKEVMVRLRPYEARGYLIKSEPSCMRTTASPTGSKMC